MPDALTERAPVFAALGDETRLRIVSRLADGQARSITTLSAGGAMSRQAVTKHLRVLEGAGLVQGERRGREQLWVVRSERLEEMQAWIEDLSRQWDVALEKLRAHVEGA